MSWSSDGSINRYSRFVEAQDNKPKDNDIYEYKDKCPDNSNNQTFDGEKPVKYRQLCMWNPKENKYIITDYYTLYSSYLSHLNAYGNDKNIAKNKLQALDNIKLNEKVKDKIIEWGEQYYIIDAKTLISECDKLFSSKKPSTPQAPEQKIKINRSKIGKTRDRISASQKNPNKKFVDVNILFNIINDSKMKNEEKNKLFKCIINHFKINDIDKKVNDNYIIFLSISNEAIEPNTFNLLLKKTGIDLKSNKLDNRNPFDYARHFEKYDKLKILLSFCKNYKIGNLFTEDNIQNLDFIKVIIETRDIKDISPNGTSLFHHAIYRNNLDMIKLLISNIKENIKNEINELYPNIKEDKINELISKQLKNEINVFNELIEYALFVRSQYLANDKTSELTKNLDIIKELLNAGATIDKENLDIIIDKTPDFNKGQFLFQLIENNIITGRGNKDIMGSMNKVRNKSALRKK